MNTPEETPDVPREFWSEYSDQPFERCIQCDVDLLTTDGTAYVIQKHVVAGETVFEMAICLECAGDLQEQFSEQSRRLMIGFIRDAPERRRRQAEDRPDHDVNLQIHGVLAQHLERDDQQDRHVRERALSCCAICATRRDECHRYSVGTACLATGLLTALPGPDDLGSPFLICEQCELRLNECISEQTRDAWDRFVEDNFDGPPGLTVDPQELMPVF